jgi:hypothetical protein
MNNAYRITLYLSLLSLLIIVVFGCQNKAEAENRSASTDTNAGEADSLNAKKPDSTIIDTADYSKRIQALYIADSSGKWNIKTPYPLPGAVLPYKRIVAFYGNLFSKRMGILGELPKAEMLKKLQEETKQWALADTTIPTVPALHYVAITAQGKPGKQNMYRQRMPYKQIDTIISWAKSIDGIVFLDIQVGHSTVAAEVSTLVNYLKLPTVHLGLDPEFALDDTHIPGSKIGTLSAAEINNAIDTLAKIVRENKLPPKILVVHRFTQGMVTDYQNIKTCPEVQVVMNMDGWGGKALKRSAYRMAIYREPVQFTGFKLFYKNDTKGTNTMLTPQEVLRLTPKPIYIQYQ